MVVLILRECDSSCTWQIYRSQNTSLVYLSLGTDKYIENKRGLVHMVLSFGLPSYPQFMKSSKTLFIGPSRDLGGPGWESQRQ